METVMSGTWDEGTLADLWRTVRTGAIWGWEQLTSRLGRGDRPGSSGEAPQRQTPPSRPVVPAPGVASLRELGVPADLAHVAEFYFRQIGAEGPDGRISGFRFVTPDGVAHALRADGDDTVAASVGRAA